MRRRTIRKSVSPTWRELNSGTFGRKAQPVPPSVRRVPCAILGGGLACLALSIGLTFIASVGPAAPFLAGLAGFVLILTAILSLEDA